MAPLNVSQATDSTLHMQLTDQDLPNEAPADSDDNFYTRWVNAINRYMGQAISTNQVYEPEDFNPLGPELDQQIN